MRFVPIDEVEEKKPSQFTFVPIDQVAEETVAPVAAPAPAVQAQDAGALTPLKFVPVEETAEVKTQNPFMGMVGRAAELAGSGISAVAEIGERVGDRLEKAVPLSGLTQQQIEEEKQLQPLFDWAKSLEGWGKEIGYAPTTQLKELADNPLNAVPFIAERVIASLPDMAASVINLPAYVTARSKEILDERVKNDNKTLDDATVGDVVTAVGAATIEGTLERFATKRLGLGTGPKSATATGRIAKEGLTQSGTEGVEEGVSYLGETAGTVRGVDLAELGERALEGAIVGGGLGATVQTGKEGLGALQGRAEEQTARDSENEIRQALVENNAEKLAPLFDSLIDQVRAENPQATEIDVIREAGSRLASSKEARSILTAPGGTDARGDKTKSGRGKPSVSVPVGDETGTPAATATEATQPDGLATTGAPATTVGAGEGTAPAALTPAVPAGFSYSLTESPAYEGISPLSVEDADFELEALQDRLSRGRQITPEIFAQSEIGKRLDTSQIMAINEGLRTDPAATIGSLRAALVPAPTPALTGEPLGTQTAQTIEAETQGQKTPAAGEGQALTEQEFLKTRDEAVSFGVRSADSAFDQQGEYGSLEEAVDAYRVNLADTITEMGVKDKQSLDIIRAAADRAFDRKVAELRGKTEAAPAAKTVPLDQVTETTPASELPTNPATGLKPPGKRGGGRKPVERTPEQQAAADQKRKDRQKVGRDSIRTAEKAKAAVDKPFNMADYDSDDAARAAALELQQERDAALVSAYRILNDKNLARDSKAKQIAQQVVDSPVFDADNRAKAQNQAKQTGTARADLIGESTNSQPDTFYEGVTDATQAIDYVIKTGNPFERLLAQRIKPFLKGVKVVIVNNPKTDIPDAKTRSAFRGAMGMYSEADGNRVLYLSNMPGMRGINNMTFLHEGVHGATMAQINAFIKDPNSVSPQARAAIESLQGIMKKAYIQYAVMQVKGRTDPLEDGLYKLGAFTDLKEFVAYGMTQPEMQDFLMKVPGQYKFDGDTLNRGLLTKFVQSIRKMFGMGPQSDSAFQDLVVVTDRLLRAGPAPVSKDTITALAKKVTKQNKTLVKLAKSRTAAETSSSVGEMVMETRNSKDALRLLRSVYDALTVGTIRKLMPTMTTMDITRWAGNRIANLKKVNDAVDKMAGMRAKMIRELAEKVPAWVEFGKKFEQGARALGDVMHASTLLSVDPTQHANLADALKNDADLQKARADYQAALNNVTLSAKQRNTAKGAVTKRENELKAVYEGGTVTNPHTGEEYVIEGWDKLGTYGNGEGHRIYKMARDSYRETFDLHQQLLIDKITKANIPGKANDPSSPKGKLIAQITQTFQEAQQLGVYFPLMRYGNYWLRIDKGKAGEFYMFESATARNNYARKRAEELKRDYDEVLADETFEVGDELNTMRDDIVESSQMLKDIFKSIEASAKVDPATGKTAITDVDAIKDQVYQMYLMTLPDRDIRKKFTHRQGKTGFSADVLRNFVTSQHTAANQLARLAYADEIRLGIGSAYAELAGNPNKLKLAAFVDEVATRATAEMTPQVPGEFNWDQLASIGNQAVFYYMLTSPKSALIQMTQLPIVGLPVLTARYGAAETAKVTARYSYLFNKFGTTKVDKDGNVTTKWGEPSINDSSYINNHPDPEYRKALKRAWAAAQDKDIFMSTYASDMSGRAQAPTGAYEGVPMKSLRFVGSLMGGAFHHLERISRETMYMSTFELAFAKAKKAGLTNDVATSRAIKEATDVVYESLFNYSQYNKPRLMKSGAIPKLATQFMTYPLQMTSFLVRNFYKSLPFAGNKQEKREAAIKFYGTLGMTGMFAGVVGLPGYSMIMGMAEGVREALRPDMEDEDEDPFYDEDDDGNPLGKRNLDLWFREWFLPTYFGPGSSLAETMGLTEEQALMLQRGVKMGPISAMTDLNIGSSVSLDGLWFRDDQPAETSKEAFQQFVFGTLTGPFGAMGEQILGAFDEFNNGQIVRGLEKLAPAFFRGIPKAFRQAEEGEQSRKGAEIKTEADYTAGKLLATTLGFQSTEVAESQKAVFAAQRLGMEVTKEKKSALDALNLAVMRLDKDPSDTNEERLDAALEAIDEYNYRNGAVSPITGETISRSLEGRAKLRASSQRGLMASPQMAPFLFPLIEKSEVPK